MTILGMQTVPGQKIRISVPVPGSAPCEAILLCGQKPGKTLVISAGVHGCEYVGILAAQRLRRELDLSRLCGQIILLPLINPNGFYHAERQIMPEDGKNLNREFPGKADGTYTQRLAAGIEQYIFPEADFLIDLHSGDWFESLTPLVFFPIAAGDTVERAARDAASCLSVPLRVASTARNGLYSRSAQLGIPSLLLERGCRAAWSETELRAELEDLYRLMAHLGMLEESAVRTTQREIRQAVYEEASCRGFWYPQVQAGAQLCVGQCLGFLTDAEGRMLCEYRAAFDGIVLYHTVILGVQEGDPLIAYGRT